MFDCRVPFSVLCWTRLRSRDGSVWVGNALRPRGVLATVLRPGAVVYHFAMNAVTRPPKDIGDFGLNFDYSIWTPNTDVYLCNVPWDATYRDVVWWDNYDESFEAIVHGHKKHSTWTQIHGLTYCAQGRPIRIDVPFRRRTRTIILSPETMRTTLTRATRSTISLHQ